MALGSVRNRSLVVLCRHARRNRAALAAALWFVVALSPVLGIFDHHAMGVSFAFSRHRYLSCIGSIALVAGYTTTVLRTRARPREELIGMVAAACFVLWCLATDWRYAVAFTKPSSWWTEMVRHEPDWDMVQSNLVTALSTEGHHEQAIGVAQRNRDRDPASLRFRWDFGFAHALAGNRTVAMDEYEVAVDALQANPSLLKADTRVWKRAHQFRSPLSKADAFYLYSSYGALLSCAGRQAAADRQNELARSLYPDADVERAFPSDDPHNC